MNTFVDEVARPLPAGTLIAASEVGYLGVQAPQANILDLAGLNDKEIGLNGFDSKSFYQRKPDVIWFPAPDVYMAARRDDDRPRVPGQLRLLRRPR